MDNEVKKVIIPAAGLGTRFLPLSKAISKEFLPLVNLPMFSYVAAEAAQAEMSQIIFVLPEEKKAVLDYFKPRLKLEGILKRRNQNELLESLKKTTEEFEKINISSVVQQKPNGDGDAVLKAKKQVGKNPFGVAFVDDVFESKVPALLQLKGVFATAQKAVVGLKRVSKEKLSFYGVVRVEKIASHLYKIKELVEKPAAEEAPSDLVIAGRYILPPEVFGYLEKTKPNKKGEIILAEALKAMLDDGKIIYGTEIEGQWLECGKTIDWLKSNLYLCLNHPEYGPVLRDYLKEIK